MVQVVLRVPDDDACAQEYSKWPMHELVHLRCLEERSMANVVKDVETDKCDHQAECHATSCREKRRLWQEECEDAPANDERC